MIRISLFVACGLLALDPGTDRPERYVPLTGWRDDAWAAGFYERWFGNQLAAMNEPSLSVASRLDGFQRRFRLLVLPTFYPASAYRIDERPDGSAVLRWVRLDGRGGYAPGEIADEGSRTLRPRETRRYRAVLQAAALTSQPREQEPLHPLVNADGTQTITVCADGTTFVLELLDAEGHHFIERSCGIEEETLRHLAREVYRLGPRLR